MNDLKLTVGERFRGNVSGNEFEIEAIKDGYAVIRDLGINKEIAYGLKALKHLAVTPVEVGEC